MQYFYLQPSSDAKIVGCIPQIYSISNDINYHVDDKEGIRYIPLEGKIPFKLKLPAFLMDPNARHTDHIVNSVINGRLITINKRLLDLFYQQNLGEHDKYPCMVRQGEYLFEYFILYLYNDSTYNVLDWVRTIFWLSNKDDKTYHEKYFKDREEYLIFLRSTYKYASIHIKRLYFITDEFTPDLIRMSVPFGWYVSERLKNSMEEAGITGLVFKPIDILEYDEQILLKNGYKKIENLNNMI